MVLIPHPVGIEVSTAWKDEFPQGELRAAEFVIDGIPAGCPFTLAVVHDDVVVHLDCEFELQAGEARQLGRLEAR